MSSIGESLAELSNLMEGMDDEQSSGWTGLLTPDHPWTSSHNDRAQRDLRFISGTYLNSGSADNQGNMAPVPNGPTEHQRGSIAQWPLPFSPGPNENFTYLHSYRNDARANFTPMPNETQSSMNGIGFDVSALLRQTANMNADVPTVSGSGCNRGCINFRPAQQNAGSFGIETNPQHQSHPKQQNRQPRYSTYQHRPRAVPNPAPTMAHEYQQLQPALLSMKLPIGVFKPFDICRQKCFNVFAPQDIKIIQRHFRSLNSAAMRSRYMVNLITPETSLFDQNRIRFTFSLEINGARTEICRRHFAHCFGMTYSVLSKFLRSTFGHGYEPLEDNRIVLTNTSATCSNCKRPYANYNTQNN